MTSGVSVELSDGLAFLVSVDDESGDTTMGGIFKSVDHKVGVRRVPLAVLRENLRQTVEGLMSVVEDFSTSEHRLKLREVQAQVEVSASGGVSLVGSAQIGATGTITLVFKE